MASSIVSSAQDLNAQALQNMLQGQPAQQPNDQQTVTPSIQVYQPVIPNTARAAPPSRLETLYSARAGRPLMQFGYDLLGVPTPVTVAQVGAVQDNYVLGQGDEVVVVLRGQENETYRQRVDRDGQIILPRLDPISAAGRSFGDFRADLESQVAQAYATTNVFVTLGEVRQISVLVTGEVRAPGARVLSGLASPLDAILLSGGIAKTGSLRNVALVRGGQTIVIDLYSILSRDALASLGSVREGDRIYVPPLGQTIAVTGMVRRPGIYELRNAETGLNADSLVQLSGGLEIAGAYRYSKMSLEADGNTRLIPISEMALVRNGEVLFVDANRDSALDRVTLSGAVQLEGAYPRSIASSVGRLLRGAADLNPQAYTAFAVIVRRDPVLNVKTIETFSLVPILTGASDIPLQNDDVVYIFRRDQIRALADSANRERQAEFLSVVPTTAGLMASATLNQTNAAMAANAANGVSLLQGVPSGSPAMTSTLNAAPGMPQGAPAPIFSDPRLQAVQQQVSPATAAIVQAAVQASHESTLSQSGGAAGSATNAQAMVAEIATALDVTPQSLVRAAGDRLIWVLDEVRDPGAYIAGTGTTLADIIQTAGGALHSADLSWIEVTSTELNRDAGTSRTTRTAYRGQADDFRRVSLQPLDVIRIRPVFTDREEGRISISGQVRYPGTFDITRGERLSSVLDRAGGLTDNAYALGAIFTRQSSAIAEREGNSREARTLEAQLATVASSPSTSDANARENISFLYALAQKLRETPTLGRIMVTADPAMLRIHPELDITLEPGDTLYIPPRPSTVTVAGEVLNAASFQYRSDWGVRSYLDLAGGTTQASDDGRVFIVLPDGSARPARQSWVSFGSTDLIPPGSTIVVPRDLKPFDAMQFFRDVTQITGQLAITAASLAVIRRD